MELKDFSTFGLNSSMAKVYLTIFNSGKLCAKEIKRLCNISATQTYNILRELREKSLIGCESGKPIYYFCLEPKVLKRLKNEKIEELEKKGEKIIASLSKTYHIKHPNFSGKVLMGFMVRKGAMERINELIKTSEKEILLFDVPVEMLRDALIEAKKRGVIVKMGFSDMNVIPVRKWRNAFEIRKIESNIQDIFFVDGEEYSSGHMFIDRKLFVNVLYKENEIVIFGISLPECVECVLHATRRLWKDGERIGKTKYEKSKVILEALRVKNLSKRELTKITGISGGEINTILSLLIEKGNVKISKYKGKGRPKEIVELV